MQKGIQRGGTQIGQIKSFRANQRENKMRDEAEDEAVPKRTEKNRPEMNGTVFFLWNEVLWPSEKMKS